MRKQSLAVLVALLVLVIVVVAALALRGVAPRAVPATPTATPVTLRPADTATPPAPVPAQTPQAGATAAAPTARATGAPVAAGDDFLAAVMSAHPPQRDLADLARRLKATATPPPALPRSAQRTIGSKDTFWVTDADGAAHFTVTATLRRITDHLYMYVQDGAAVNDAAVSSAAEWFESRTYPTDRRYFGTGWGPGLDGDLRVTVLNAHKLGGASGFFSSADEESTIGNPYSNGRHMIYMNLDSVLPGTVGYNDVLAHEFQHAIHFFEDRNEDAWINEGAGVLAERLNGFNVSGSVNEFVRYPQTQLDTWGDDPSRLAHYGAAFAFLDYFYERYGEAALRSLIANDANGAEGFNQTLAGLGKGERFNDVFADWMVANVLDDPSLEGGRYGYRDAQLRLGVGGQKTLPTTATVSANQYSGAYVNFTVPSAGATVYFSGTQQVRLVANQAQEGAYQWWSNRADLMDSTMTRAFDLGGLTRATLSFWTWYDLEEDWDYAYLEISIDGGQTWATLATPHTTTTNPVGNNLGNGYTGRSGGGKTAQWVQERVDLTPYAGRQIMLRFEYVTDDAVNNPGFSVDSISIPELGYSDGAESADSGWQTQGFLRSPNVVPQPFVIKLITFGAGTTVADVPVDAQGFAQVRVEGAQRAILAVAGVAPVTTEQAKFAYSIR